MYYPEYDAIPEASEGSPDPNLDTGDKLLQDTDTNANNQSRKDKQNSGNKENPGTGLDKSQTKEPEKPGTRDRKDDSTNPPVQDPEKAAREAAVKFIEAELNALAQRTSIRAIALRPGSGLSWPVDTNTGKPWSLDRVREGLINGTIPLKLADPGNSDQPFHMGTSTISEGADDLAMARLNTALSHSLIELNKIFKDKPPPGWLPPADIVDKDGNLNADRARAYLTRVMPWIDSLKRASVYVATIQDLDEASNAGNHFMFSRMGEQSFAESIDAEKEFPGTITHDPITGKILFSVAKPNALFPTPGGAPGEGMHYYTNAQQRRALEEWMRKIDAPIQQVLSEFNSAKRGEHRLCLWGDIPGEGKTPDHQEYNNTQYRTATQNRTVKITNPDGTEVEEPFIQVTTYRQRQWLSALSYQGWGLVEDVGKPEESGYATINGEKLQSGKSLYLSKDGKTCSTDVSSDSALEFRLTEDGRVQAKIISTNADKDTKPPHIRRINGLTGKTEEHDINSDKWVDIMAGDSLTVGDQAVDWQNDVRLYRPNDWVGIQDGNGPQIMQAKNLESWVAESKFWHYGSKAATLALDVSMVATGFSEARAAAYIGKKALETITEEAVKKAVEQGAKDLLARNAGKEIFFGLTGLGRQAIENYGNEFSEAFGIGKAGNGVMAVRDGLLMLDLTANNLKLFSKQWGSIAGKGNADLMSYYLRQGRAVEDLGEKTNWREVLVKLNEGVMKISGVAVDIDMTRGIVNTTGDAIAGTSDRRRNSQDRGAAAIARLREADNHQMNRVTRTRATDAIIEQLLTRLNSQSKKRIEKELSNLKVDQKELNKYAYKFSSPNSSQEDRLISALALLKLSKEETGLYSTSIKTIDSSNRMETTISLNEIDSFLQNYRPVQFNNDQHTLSQSFDTWVKDCGQQFNQPDDKALIEQTAEALRGSKDQIANQKLNLLAIYNSPYSLNNQKLIASVGLLLLSTNPEDTIVNTTLAQREGILISVEGEVPDPDIGAGRRTTFTKKVFDGSDPESAIKQFRTELARTNYVYFPLQGDLQGSVQPITEQINAAEAVKFIQSQLTQDGVRISAARIATGNLLRQFGQLSDIETVALSLEILSNHGRTVPDQTNSSKIKEQETRDKASAILNLGPNGLGEILANQKFKVEPEILQIEDDQLRAMRLAEIGDLNSQHISEALLVLARDPEADIHLRTLAIAALAVANIDNDKDRHKAIVDLRTSWQEHLDNPNSARGDFAKSQVSGWLNELATDTASTAFSKTDREQLNLARSERVLLDFTANASDGSDSLNDLFANQKSAFAKREKHFLAALNLNELSKSKEAGLTPEDKHKIYSALLDCVRTEREDAISLQLAEYHLTSTEQQQALAIATASSRHTQAQAFEILFTNFKDLTADQQRSLIEKSYGVLTLPNDNLAVSTEPALKIAITQYLNEVLPGRPIAEQERYAQTLQNNINLKIPYQLSQYIAGQEVINNQVHLMQVSLNSLSRLNRGINQLDTINYLTQLAKNQNNNPHARLASIDALAKMRAPDLIKFSQDLIKIEQDIMIYARLQNIIELNNAGTPAEYEQRYRQAQEEITVARTSVSPRLSDGRQYIHDNFKDSVLSRNIFSYTPEGTPIEDTLGPSGVLSSTKQLAGALLEGTYDGVTDFLYEHHGIYIQNHQSMERDNTSKIAIEDGLRELAEKAKQNSRAGAEARNALAYIVLSNGEPFNERFRDLAASEAAYGLELVCRYGANSVKKDILPLITQCMIDQPLMSRENRGLILKCYNSLSAESENIATKEEAAKVITQTLQHEIRRMPQTSTDAGGEVSEDLQRDLLFSLSRHASEDQLPALLAITGKRSDGTPNHPMPEITRAAEKILSDLQTKLNLVADAKRFTPIQLANYESMLAAMNVKQGHLSLGAIHSTIDGSWFRYAKGRLYEGLDGITLESSVRASAEKRNGLWYAAGYSPDYEGLMRDYYKIGVPFNDLRSDAISEAHATDSIGQQARSALAYIVLSNGRPFASEATRLEMTNEAARTMNAIVKNKCPSAGEMLSIAAAGLTECPTLDPSTRLILLDTLKAGVDTTGVSGNFSQAQSGQIVASALEQEYKRMPSPSSRDYESSERVQVAYLEYLRSIGYKANEPVLRALYEGSSSERVKLAAAQGLNLSKTEIAYLERRVQFSISSKDRTPQQRADNILRTLAKPSLDNKEKIASILKVISEECSAKTFPNLNDFTTDEFLADPRVILLLEMSAAEDKRISLSANATLASIFIESGQLVPPSVIGSIYRISLQEQKTETNPFADRIQKHDLLRSLVDGREATQLLAQIEKHYKASAPEYWQETVLPILQRVAAEKKDTDADTFGANRGSKYLDLSSPPAGDSLPRPIDTFGPIDILRIPPENEVPDLSILDSSIRPLRISSTENAVARAQARQYLLDFSSELRELRARIVVMPLPDRAKPIARDTDVLPDLRVIDSVKRIKR